MYRTRSTAAIVAAVMGLTGVAPVVAEATTPPDSTDPPVAASGSGLPVGDEPVDLDPAQFTTDIDNPFWPMAPGTQWTYREIDVSGAELVATVTVTTATREIANGVTARVVRDTVTSDGEIIEDTFDWYAQDADGNIWYLGEDTAEFEGGAVTSTSGSFEAGIDGALPGVIVPAHPEPGLQYRQEYYAGEAEDNGEILSTTEQVDVPAGHFDVTLLTKDTITIEPNVLEYKMYAPGVGPVLALGISGGGGREELVQYGPTDATVADAAGTTPLGQPYLN